MSSNENLKSSSACKYHHGFSTIDTLRWLWDDIWCSCWHWDLSRLCFHSCSDVYSSSLNFSQWLWVYSIIVVVCFPLVFLLCVTSFFYVFRLVSCWFRLDLVDFWLGMIGSSWILLVSGRFWLDPAGSSSVLIESGCFLIGSCQFWLGLELLSICLSKSCGRLRTSFKTVAIANPGRENASKSR